MRTVLIDGDVLIYRASSSCQEEFTEEGIKSNEWYIQTIKWASKKAVKARVDKELQSILKKTKSQDFILAFTDKGHNFRKTLNPNYKSNRKAPKPLLYEPLREYFRQSNFKTYEKPYLEGDDIIGILATSDKLIKGDKVIWSLDKDFKTIPCKFRKEFPDGSHESMIITENEADWWFMYQTLVGDVTDGYKGCPNVGDKKARKILGEIGEYPLPELWGRVVETYISNKQTEKEALLNARMARILRASDYDFKKKEVILWHP